ncbi:MAG: sn-glycerol-3-phosphate ABC transporter ATP-binding protein UgpC [Deltaproteobacteria bacterium]|nr:sn-glycerol-3-phosphate ABC transporter ATP-binding protein UgpC [Deltaproteobacteria bacterium]
MSSLKLSGISKCFGDVVAASDVDLLVNNGEFCVLLGPSGCGKSTLLQIVAGLVPQDRGSVVIDGRSVDNKGPKERDVAMVFQSYALYPHMTVIENLGFALRMRGMRKNVIKERVTQTARILGIEPLLNRKPKHLSGGQRQRVAMGRALVREPSIFLLDEPLSNLDAQLRMHVRMELKKLHQESEGTFIHVTHDQVEAMSLGDQVAVMKEGRIHQTGSPEDIYDRPADTFVATFVGSPVMNLFKGSLAVSAGQTVFRCRDFAVKLQQLPKEWENREVEIGFRPEDVKMGTQSGPVIHARVEMVSNVGAEKHIHARVGKSNMTLRVEKDAPIRAGDNITFSVRPSGLHVFSDGKRVGGFQKADAFSNSSDSP